MTTGYPFVAITKNKDIGYFVSIDTLESKGAPDELIQALVHGPLKLATELMSKWSGQFIVEPNPSLQYED